MPQKLFRVKIYAYQYHADFIVKSADSALDIENAIVDTLGKDEVKFEKNGFTSKTGKWITYEEVIDGGDNATSGDPLHTEEGTRSSMGAGAS